MFRRLSSACAVSLVTASLSACSNAPTSTLNRQATSAPQTAAPASASPLPTASAQPTATPTSNPAATSTPTPGPISLSPTSVAAANVVPAPGSDHQPSVCATGSPTNYTCFSGDPTEVDPTEARYAGAFSTTSANQSIAVTMACGSAGAPNCSSANGFLVYPQGVGTTTVTVSDTSGNTSTLPVSVSETTVDITLQGLSSAQQVCVGYTTSSGANGSFVSYATVANPSSNPTIVFANVPAPVNVNYTMFRAVVNPPNSGMSGCANGIAQMTLSKFQLAAGVKNTENITVTTTSQ